MYSRTATLMIKTTIPAKATPAVPAAPRPLPSPAALGVGDAMNVNCGGMEKSSHVGGVGATALGGAFVGGIF